MQAVPLFLFCYHSATTFSKDGIFQPAGGLLIGGLHQVGIDVQGYRGAAVSYLRLNVF